ncbi:hypothetical protein DFJ58DRAFT_748614 [Suillus subalutaceus]|uniref:uncharacterized protein n=1 Tax=Suillus subalutaceus TaxID=48586 RepID=UPI001B884806|nr:uncharacterized protein DFJ58DRAFT_748614 [Suillus subalutaceus]KAG1840826.1 hypothetical protein DFJ58DRAFT_748614 [Suillus subalutaceus]
MPDQSESQYAAAVHVPLIKSPGLRVPPLVRNLSSSSTYTDLLAGASTTRHPPLSLIALLHMYVPPTLKQSHSRTSSQFVYPYTLEPHILTVESSRRMTLAAHTARREAYLRAREDEHEWRRKEALRRVAPGFDPTATLVPVRAEVGEVKTDVMDQLVDQLAKMENDS